MGKTPDWYNEYARKRLGQPEQWHWFSLESVGYQPGTPISAKAVIVVGADLASVPLFVRGKNKGQPNWRKRDTNRDVKLVIPETALNLFKLEWETSTGKCSKCGGDGQAWAGWSQAEGTKWVPCGRCGATGAAPVKPAGSRK